MIEWGVVLVLAALVSLGVAIVKPMLSFKHCHHKVDRGSGPVTGGYVRADYRNTEAHRRIWDHNEEQDKQLGDHEQRIVHLERK